MDLTQSIWSTGTMALQRHHSLMVFSSSGLSESRIAISITYIHHSAAGADILLVTPPSSEVSLVQYRMIGGVLDFYFFSGPSPQGVIEQYGALIGLPTFQPMWGFGFQLCR
jgi:alpha-glucosidase (family GH31 glycosyl hydrolase)